MTLKGEGEHINGFGFIMEEKGKLLYSNYLTPQWDKYRKAMKIFTIFLLVLFLTTILISFFYYNQFIITIGLASFVVFIWMLISKFRFHREDFRIYENGIEGRFLRPTKGKTQTSYLGTPVGKRFFSFDRIAKIYHRTDIGKPIRPEVSQITIGVMLVRIDISDINLCVYLPITSIAEALPLLEKKLGERWNSVYNPPEEI